MAKVSTLPRDAAELAQALSLRQARRIFLKNFAVQVSIGIHDFEKAAAQRVLVNVDLYLETKAGTLPDSIEQTVDYDFLRGEISRIAAGGHFNLQETFCERILAACLDRRGVIAARVSSEKPDVYPDCDSVGCDIFRVK